MNVRSHTVCANCGAKLRVEPEKDLRRLRCPRCLEPLASTSSEEPDPVARAVPDQSQQQTETYDAGRTLSYSDVGGYQPSATVRQIGRFEIRRILGKGGFGRVLLAYDPVLDRNLALKVPRFAADETRHVERFVREAKAAARLRHPNIVAVFESGRIGDQYYIAAEYVDGKPLSVRLAEGSIDFRDAARWIREIAQALAYAHSEGIIHRDIKPQNVMLGGNDRPQVMDFGLAKRVDEDATLTIDGSVLGTPAYMSPEQARGDVSQVGPAADQYSLGVMLYEMLTGQRPFDGPPQSVIPRVIEEEPAAPRTLRDDIPLDLETICQKAMAKDASRRYPDCGELAEDLRRWLDDEPIEARRVGLAERATRWSRRNPQIAVLLALVVLLTTTGLIGMSVLLGRAESERARADDAAESLSNSLEEQEKTSRDLAAALTTAEENETRAQQNEQLAKQEAARAKNAETEAQQKATELAQTIAELEAANKRLTDALAELDTQREVATTASDSAALNLYLQEINTAYNQWQSGDLVLAAETLNRCPEALRGWEWNYLKQFRVPSSESLPGLGFGSNLVLRDDYTQLAAWHSRGSTVQMYDTQTFRYLGAYEYGTNVAAVGIRGQEVIVLGTDGSLSASGKNNQRESLGRIDDEALLLRNGPPTAFNRDATKLAVAGSSAIQVWDTSTSLPNLLGGFPNTRQRGPVRRLFFAGSGERLAVFRQHGFELWDGENLQLVGDGPHFAANISPDGDRMAVSRGREVEIIDGEVNSLLTFDVSENVDALCFTHDARRLGVIHNWGNYRILSLRDAATGDEIVRIHLQSRRTSRRRDYVDDWCQFSPDARRLFFLVGMRVYELDQVRNASRLIGTKPATRMSFSQDGHRVVGAGGPHVETFNVRPRRELTWRTLHNDTVNQVALSADGTLAASWSNNVNEPDDGVLKIMDAETGDERLTIATENVVPSAHGRWLAFDGSGQRLALPRGNELLLYQVDTGESLPPLAVSGDSIYGIWPQDEGWLVLSAKQMGTRRTLHLIRLPAGDELATLDIDGTRRSTLPSAALDADLTSLALEGPAGIEIWDLASGQQRVTMAGRQLLAFDLSPDGSRLAAVASRGAVNLYDARAGQRILELARLSDVGSDRDSVTVRFSPDGNMLAVAHGPITIFDATPLPEPKEEAEEPQD